MKLSDISARISFEVWLEPVFSFSVANNSIGFLSQDSLPKTYKLRIDNTSIPLKLHSVSAPLENDLNFHLQRGFAHLAEIAEAAKDGRILLRILFFSGELVELGDIEVGLDERIVDTAKRNGLRFNSVERLNPLLQEKCKITANGDDYFVFLTAVSAKSEFDYEESNSSQVSVEKAVTTQEHREFSIQGDRIRIPVGKRKIDNANEIYFATKLIFKDRQSREGALRLARGSLSFSDFTKTGRIRALAAGAMSQLTKETGSYLKKWDEYGATEGSLLLEQARAIGRIDFHAVEVTYKGIKVFSNSIPEGLSEGDELEVTSEEPSFIRDPELTWEEFNRELQNEFESKKSNTYPSNEAQDDSEKEQSEQHTSIAKVLSISKTSIELNLPSAPPEKSFLVPSINGDKVQIERRMRARTAILEGKSANPLLGLLIEEGGKLPNTQRQSKLKPLTPFVKSKIFKHEPTDKQVEAIEVALNTPDIALIQGPPGTGKTTVITAILERLNEEFDKSKSIKGQILISGFQHDAVENIVSRLSVNSLPAVKFGKRSGESEFTEDAVTQKIDQWCSAVAEKIRSNNPQISNTEEQVRLASLFATYTANPSTQNTEVLLRAILALPRTVLDEKMAKHAASILENLNTERAPTDNEVLRLIRALRVTETGFLDDGKLRALELLDRLEEIDSDIDLTVLETAARWKSGKELSFLEALNTFKDTLLYRYIPTPEFHIEKPREDVLKLVANISQLLSRDLKSASKRDSILAEFLHELEDNPDGVREAIADYNFIFAATTQQADGKAIKASKNKGIRFEDRDKLVTYDTVIIDEAARTSPRDLLIPMSQAEKRIILVGDHRQLPHLIDETVARAMESEQASETTDEDSFIKKSMFEYLFHRLKKLEADDGIKRTVTLDAQYRTHPLLGNFASENFYQKYDEGYRSPLPEKYFLQALPGIENRAAVWIDVPNSQGKEELLATKSRRRKAEARVIAERLKHWIDSDEGSNLSFGVISFYKGQVYAVFEELERYGISERSSDGAWQIVHAYRFLPNGEERLRLGTVDAFQGMEFDIVFLSIVRSQDMGALPEKLKSVADPSKRSQKLFGHLVSENRLCVSMSRQKRVLAIVGDAAFSNSGDCKSAVPALSNFYSMCASKGVIL